MPKVPWSRRLSEAARAATDILRKPRTTTRPQRRPSRPPRESSASRTSTYPGDFNGRFTPLYEPVLDGDADPGEIVWTWVPYEEDHSKGKDRPILIVGLDEPWLLGLMLSSKDHNDGPRPNNTDGPQWLDIGSGPWDSRGRDSEVRLDRIIRVDPTTVRREGAIMDRATFEKVAGFLT